MDPKRPRHEDVRTIEVVEESLQENPQTLDFGMALDDGQKGGRHA